MQILRLQMTVSSATHAEFASGSKIKVVGLKARSDYNGTFGEVIRYYQGRCAIRLSSGECIRVKPQNITSADDFDPAAEEPAVDRATLQTSPRPIHDTIEPAPIAADATNKVSSPPPTSQIPAPTRASRPQHGAAISGWDVLWRALLAVATLIGASVGAIEKKWKLA